MSESGLLVEVRWEWDGTEAAAAASLGASTLTVADPEALAPNERVWIADTGPYLVSDTDEDTGVVTLTATLTTAVEEGDPVALDMGGQPARVWVAEVILVDDDEPIEVPLTAQDLVMMPEGIYDPPRAIEISDSLDEVLDLPGALPTVSGAILKPGTVPGIPDLLPPASPTTLSAVQGVDAIHLRWTPVPNPDAVTYDVYVSETALFDHTTMDPVYSDLATTGVAVRSLADGTRLEHSVNDPDLGIDVPVPYYFQVVVKDEDGEGPPSNEVATTLKEVDNVEISALYAYLGTISASQITSDVVDAVLTIAQSIIAGGGKIVMGGTGLVINNSLGQPVMTMDTVNDVFQLVCKATTESLAVLGDFSLYEQTNFIERDGKLYLASGVQGPTTAPTPTIVWDSVATSRGFTKNWQRNFTWDSGNNRWMSAWTLFWDGHVQFFTAAGAPNGGFDVADQADGDRYPPFHGVTKIGSNFYAVCTHELDPDPAKRYVRKYDSTGAFVSQATIATFLDTVNAGTVGTDGTNLAVANVGNDGVLRIRLFDISAWPTITVASTLVTDLTDWDVNNPTGLVLSSLHYGTFDFGGATNYWGVGTRNRKNSSGEPLNEFRFFNASTGVQDTTKAFPMADNDSEVCGMGWNGSTFQHLSATADEIKQYSTIKWGSESSKWWVANSWKDTDTGGDTTTGPGDGTHETKIGTATGFTMKKRAKVRLTSVAVPDKGGNDDPNAANFYLATPSATKPDIENEAVWWRHANNVAADPAWAIDTAAGPAEATISSVTIYDASPNADTQHPNPPTTNQFLQTNPAEIASQTGGFVVRGDGTGDWPKKSSGVFRRVKESLQTLSNTTWEKVGFPTLDWSDNAVTTATNNTFTINDAGVYMVSVRVVWDTNATGRRQVLLTRNDDDAVTSSADADAIAGVSQNGTNSGDTAQSLFTIRRFAASDYLRVWALQASGGNLDIVGTNSYGRSEITITKLGVES